MDGPRNCHTSEVNQKVKNKYCILMHICGIQKNGTEEPICRAEMETDVQMYECQGWGEGRCGVNWEVGIDIYTLLCIK